MEIELKYFIASCVSADDILNSRYLRSIEEPDTRDTIEMKAVYFDTENYDLMKNGMAFRVREEGSKLMATLKWDGVSDGAFHSREELNVPVREKSQLEKPNLVVFEESDIGEMLIEMTRGQKLVKLMETNFTRQRLRVSLDDSIMEVSIDNGSIITEVGSAPICELEIELFSGDEETLVKLGNKLCNQFALKQGEKSKYERGIDILKEAGKI